jgi:alpha-tubulin suppressor-like RCC1 family protein
VTSIAGGGYHSLAISAGTAFARGYNAFGQLGDGTTTSRTTRVAVANLSGVTSVAAGTNYSLAATSSGTAYAWGHNGSGQLGDGTTTNRSTPAGDWNYTLDPP